MRRRHKVIGVLGGTAVLALGIFALAVSHNQPCPIAPLSAATGTLIKADVYRCYGSPDVIRLEDIPKPTPAEGRMIVKVRAASVNPLDWHYLRGEPYIVRLFGAGLGSPDDIRLGVDFAGTVESVGQKVTRFKPGDDVFGSAGGAFAEYVSVREAGAVTLKPSNISFEQAAAVPIAAVTALQALREKGQVQPGQSVLINGASGGVGTFAVQIAKVYGAEVTGVSSTRNLDLVRSIGADHVIDYTREDFTFGTKRYDLIIDTVGNHSLSEYRRVMTKNGTLVMVGGQDKSPWMFATLVQMLERTFSSPFISQKFLGMLAEQNQDNLGELRDWMQQGKVTPVIDRRYSLSDVPEAMRYVEMGHAHGKVVIDLEQPLRAERLP